MNVFELFATLSLDTSSYDEGLTNAESKGSAFGNALGSVIKTGGKIAVGALAATTTATIAGTKAFIDGVASTAEYADSIDKLSQKMGFGVESFQEWQYVAQISGTSMESLKAGMKTLSTAVETGSEAFDKLGLSQEELAEMSQEELFDATIQGLMQVSDESERMYLASQLLGKGATELGPMLNLTQEELNSLKDEAHSLNGVLSEEQVKAGAQFQDSLLGMQTAMNGLKNDMMSEFLPAFSTVMDGLALIFSGDDTGLGMIDEGVDNFIGKLNEVVPKAFEIGTSILNSLISSITSNLPALLEQGSGILSELLTGIISALPAVLQSALIIIGEIGKALLDNADFLIETAIGLIETLVLGLNDPASIEMVTNAVVNITTTLVNAISMALPVILPAVVNILTTVILTLTSPSNISQLVNAVLTLVGAVAVALFNSLPIYINYIFSLMGNIEAIFWDAVNWVATVMIPAIVGFWDQYIAPFVDELLINIGNFFLDIWNFYMDFANNIISGVTGFFSDIWNFYVQLVTNLATGVTSFFSGIFNSCVSALNNITNTYVSFLSNGISAVTGFFSDIGSFISNGFNDAIDFVIGFGSDLLDNFNSIFDNAVSVVSDAIDNILNLFNFEWSLPDIKLPHFSISGSLDLLADPPTYPSVSVDWYKKGYSDAYILSGATIFGAQGGSLLGAGEGAGSEVVVGTSKLISMMSDAVREAIGGQTTIIPVYIGNEKIDELVVKSNQRTDYVSGGR